MFETIKYGAYDIITLLFYIDYGRKLKTKWRINYEVRSKRRHKNSNTQ